MLDRPERFHRLTGDALSRTVVRDQLGNRGFEIAELTTERIVLAVGDLRPGLDVVGVVVVADGLAQLGDPLSGIRPIHAPKDSTWLVGASRAARANII